MKRFWKSFALTILLFTSVCGIKKYRSCFRHKCQADTESKRCCRIGVKAANQGYDCTVDTFVATQRYRLSFQQKSHTKFSKKFRKFLNKVKRCKSHDTCLECCCKHRRKRIQLD